VERRQPITRSGLRRDIALQEVIRCLRCAMSRPNIASIRSRFLKVIRTGGRGLVESRRGLGMFINAGARSLSEGRTAEVSWRRMAQVYATIQRLGLNAEELWTAQTAGRLRMAHRRTAESNPPKKER